MQILAIIFTMGRECGILITGSHLVLLRHVELEVVDLFKARVLADRFTLRLNESPVYDRNIRVDFLHPFSQPRLLRRRQSWRELPQITTLESQGGEHLFIGRVSFNSTLITNFDKLFSRSCINAKTFYSTAEKNSGMGLAIALERKNRREISRETGLGTAG